MAYRNKIIIITFVILLLGTIHGIAQIGSCAVFKYDASGNRFFKEFVACRTGNSSNNNKVTKGVADSTSISMIAQPNPAANTSQVIINTTGKRIAGQAFLYDITGKLLWQELVNSGSVYLDLTDYSKGVYIFRFVTDAGTAETKLLSTETPFVTMYEFNAKSYIIS